VNPEALLRRARGAISVRRVFGEPVEHNGVVLVPAASVRGGGGGGSDERDNGGGGFGIVARPVGAYVIRDGDVRWRPAVDVNRAVLGAQLLLGLVALVAWRTRRR
jgi:uncharacterized spore protein YtfJ